MAKHLYLVELTAWDPAIPGVTTLRYASGRGFATRPTATPPNEPYDARVQQAVTMERTMFAPGATMGRSQTLLGDLVLLNPDGELDKLMRYGLSGRSIRVLVSDKDWPKEENDFDDLLIGTMLQAEFARDSVTVRIKDRQSDFSMPLQTNKYAGNNVLPDGLEGLPTDLLGKVKPVVFGIAKNVSPPLVNTARLIYQVNDGEINTVDAVYDRGVALAKGADYISQADMETNIPAAGSYRVWPGGGYFRLGSTPDGQITADVTQGIDATARKGGSIYYDLIQRASKANQWIKTGVGTNLATDLGALLVTETGVEIVVVTDVSLSDVADVNAENPAELGAYFDKEVTMADAADGLADTLGAWWGVNKQGIFRLQVFKAPASGDSVLTIKAGDVKSLERRGTADPGGGIPVYRQTVRWGRFFTTQNDVAASVTAARRSELVNEWRHAVATDATLQEAHLLSEEVVRDSWYTTAADAQAEANRRLALYTPRRDLLPVTIELNRETSSLDLGHVVTLMHPRYGLQAGAPFTVIGFAPDARRGELAIELWGTAPI